uniref:Iodothyronine deiodinase n=1 Tax=Polypedates teraiensis TaxID=1179784 RepID=A0A977XFP7_9NEOB|nr:DIO3 [Polypedates teraiensis]
MLPGAGGAHTCCRSQAHTCYRRLSQALSGVMLLPRFLLTALMLWLLDYPCIRRRLLRPPAAARSPEDPPLCVSDGNRLCTVESLKAVWYGQKLDWLKSAHVGGVAPNTEVVTLEGPKRCRILDFSDGHRPLVVNFGSCS